MIISARARTLLGSWLLALVTIVGLSPNLIGCEGNGGEPCEHDDPDQGENCG